MSGGLPQGEARSQGDARKTWEERLNSKQVEFVDLVNLKLLQTHEDPAQRAVGEAYYEAALDSFRAERRRGDATPAVAIFAPAGCGVYLPPEGRLWYTVIERAIGFDWSAAQRLLLRIDNLARRAPELWRVEPLQKVKVGRGEEAQSKSIGLGRIRKRWQAARARRLIADQRPHSEQAYFLCSSVFSAVNLEKRNRLEQAKAGQALLRKPSDEFLARLDVIRPEVEAAEAMFRRAAQRYALACYARGMLLGVVGIGLVGLAIAIAFYVHQVPAWYGVALLAGGIGAVISVLQRMASGRLRLDYDAGSGMLLALGAVRPLIGAVFGMVLFAAVDGGWLPSIAVSPAHALAFYFVLGFLAGFNERFAQDMLAASAAQVRVAAPAAQPSLPVRGELLIEAESSASSGLVVDG